jgi:RNase H-fold protein (predicted Holliday junction resolvase)
MPRKEINILTVNPGTKYIGLAVFQGPDLTYWGIKAFKGKWSKKKLDKIKSTLLNLIGRYGITRIVLKKVNHSRSSGNLNQLIKAIESLAEKNRLKVSLYRLGDVKKLLGQGAKVNKVDIAGLVVSQYSFLSSVLEKERKNKHPYFTRMFEAIGAGVLVLKCLKH